jgi:hypothetical protein
MAAEGNNPYWCNAETMQDRLAFHQKVVAEQPDSRFIAMFVSKSNNDNFVIYKWENDTSVFKPYWIIIKDRASAPYERKELNALDLTMYAPNLAVRDTGDWEITLNTPQLAMHVLSLSLNDADEPTLTLAINGRRCIMEKAFVEMRQGLLPDVDRLTVYGRAVDTNETLTQVITN